MKTNLSRRSFVTAGAAVAATALGGLALTGCSSAGGGSASSSNGASSVTWDEETDVVVIGFGGAGASAAIAASDAGASVILLEKAPEKDAGGNTSVSGGGGVYCTEDKKDECFDFLRYQMPDTITDEEIAAFAEELSTQESWLADHGATLTVIDGAGAMYAHHPLSGGMNKMFNINGTGAGLFAFLKKATEGSAGVSIRYETPAHRLIFDPETKEVFGVVVTGSDGADINIKASRAVIMTCGGFENDHHMKTTYYPPNVPIFPCGTPYNTGDGIRMITEIGAKLRGFSSIEWGCHCCKAGSEEVGVALGMSFQDKSVWNGAIMVNDQGKRFVNETGAVVKSMPSILRPLHEKNSLPETAFDMNTLRYTNLPMFMVVDAKRLQEAPLFTAATSAAGNHWANVHKLYSWSDDNQTEVEKGWVIKADSLDELATKMGIDAAGLKETVESFNAAVVAGADSEFDRTEYLQAIENPPFYATELGLGLINTQGGPERDGYHHVLDNEGNPIPRLYAGGEFGSIYTWLYQGAGNISETIAARAAGKHAAEEEPWGK